MYQHIVSYHIRDQNVELAMNEFAKKTKYDYTLLNKFFLKDISALQVRKIEDKKTSNNKVRLHTKFVVCLSSIRSYFI